MCSLQFDVVPQQNGPPRDDYQLVISYVNALLFGYNDANSKIKAAIV